MISGGLPKSKTGGSSFFGGEGPKLVVCLLFSFKTIKKVAPSKKDTPGQRIQGEKNPRRLLIGTVPYFPLCTQILIVAHLSRVGPVHPLAVWLPPTP